MAAGLISKEEFLTQAQDLCRQSQNLMDGWRIDKMADMSILCKTVTQQIQPAEQSINLDLHPKWQKLTDEDNDPLPSLETEYDNNDDENDEACLKMDSITGSVTLLFEYHVIYSESYSVPVLYVNVTKSDGKLLSLGELWDLVPTTYRERLEEDKWTFLTQQEHPLLGRPFYQLHPCHTESLMANVPKQEQETDTSRCKSNNYLIAWLSAVGPVVHLKLPLEYGKIT